MFGTNKVTSRWFLAVAVLVAVVIAAACTPPASPAPTPAASIPEITVEASDSGLTAPAEMPAGLVAVTVSNSGQAPHAPLFARLNEGVTQDQFMQALETDESGAAAVALVSLLGGLQAAPGASQRVIYDMKPGNHVIVDFGEGPPQIANFVVNGAGDAAAPAPASTVDADLVDFNFALPDQIKAGAQTWKIENKGQQWHEMAIVRLNEGVAVEDLLAMMSEEQPQQAAPPWEDVAFWAPMSAGERAWTTLDLPAGEYTVLCFLPDFGSTPPKSHLEHGMVRTLTVTE